MNKRKDNFINYWLNVQTDVKGYIRLFINNEADADDILQDVAIIAYKKFEEYNKTTPFRSWVIGIARYEVLAKRKKYAKNKILYYPELFESISDAYEEIRDESNDKVSFLKKCIQKLDDKNYKLLKLRYGDLLRIKKISVLLGLKPVTIRVRLNRVRNTLKNCINSYK